MGQRQAAFGVVLLVLASLTATHGQCPLGLAAPALVVPPVFPEPGVSDPVWLGLMGSTNTLLGASLYAANQLHALTTLWIASYDGLVPYTSHAGYVIGNGLKRNASERTLANKKLAVYYTVYHTMIGLYGPGCLKEAYDAVFASAGLDPDSPVTALSSPIGVGKAVAAKLVHFFKNDGFNLDGNHPDVEYNRLQFSDYSAFEPANTAYKLKDPRKWQPQRVAVGYGVTLIQEYTGAQVALAKTFSYKSPKDLKLEKPYASLHFPSHEYKRQADEIVALSKNLTDYDKVIAEFVDAVPNSLQAVAMLVNRYKLSFEKHVLLMGLLGGAVRDATIAIFYYKGKFNTVRPFSAIQSSGIYKGKIHAWGGPYKGTVWMHPGEWRQYVRFTAPEPEYPSGAVTLGTVFATILPRYFNTSVFDYNPTVLAGASLVEPQLTPTKPVTLKFPTFGSLVAQNKYGRMTGGVHFQEGVDGGEKLGRKAGKIAWKKFQSLLKGIA